MRDLLEMRSFIEQSLVDDELVLCTLVSKKGSSYRGVGAKKVISLKGTSCGLLSGGCLEGSIEKTAREELSRMPFVKSFSTLAEEDRLMGYQTGCQGVIDILFEKISINTELNQLLPYDPVELYVVGCGADAPAYRDLGRALGWNLYFLDYRSDLAKTAHFPGEKVQCLPLSKIAERIPQGRRVAVILMTHNYEADLEILRGIKNHRIGYLGCLGPAARYEKLKSDLLHFYSENVGSEIESVVSAPCGLFPHSQSPHEIALSVIAEIQGKLVEQQAANNWTLILAAGASSRFGSPKALAEFQGRTLLARALETAKSFSQDKTLVVLGGYAEILEEHVGQTRSIFNPRWKEGMGTSIATGIQKIRELDANVDNIAILPVDQPLVSAQHLQGLSKQSELTQRCALTSGADFVGPPAVLPQVFFERALQLQGERGLKSFLKPSEIILVDGPMAMLDVDSPDDLKQLIEASHDSSHRSFNA